MKTRYKEKVCIICNKVYNPTSGTQKTCSVECRKLAISVRQRKVYEPTKVLYIKTCEICKHSFETQCGHAKVCSTKCRNRLHYIKYNMSSNIKKCIVCGGIISHDIPSTTCEDCEMAMKRKKNLHNLDMGTVPIHVICKQCGAFFDEYNSSTYCEDCAKFRRNIKRWRRTMVRTLTKQELDLCVVCGDEMPHRKNREHCKKCKRRLDTIKVRNARCKQYWIDGKRFGKLRPCEPNQKNMFR